MKYAADLVASAMVKLCSVSRTVIAVPSQLVAHLHIARLHLNDPSCAAAPNGTHHVVASHSTACGSTALTYGNAPMFRNNLVAVFASGDPLAGQQFRWGGRFYLLYYYHSYVELTRLVYLLAVFRIRIRIRYADSGSGYSSYIMTINLKYIEYVLLNFCNLF